jgi:hypothetical protein
MKIPVLLLLAWTAQQSEAREVFQIAPLGRIPETWNYSVFLIC